MLQLSRAKPGTQTSLVDNSISHIVSKNTRRRFMITATVA